MLKRSLLSVCVTAILGASISFAQTPEWVIENSENAEGIITPRFL